MHSKISLIGWPGNTEAIQVSVLVQVGPLNIKAPPSNKEAVPLAMSGILIGLSHQNHKLER